MMLKKFPDYSLLKDFILILLVDSFILSQNYFIRVTKNKISGVLYILFIE